MEKIKRKNKKMIVMLKTFKQRFHFLRAYIYEYYIYYVKDMLKIAGITIFFGFLLLLIVHSIMTENYLFTRSWDGKNLNNYTEFNIFGYNLSEQDYYQEICFKDSNITIIADHLHNTIKIINRSCNK